MWECLCHLKLIVGTSMSFGIDYESSCHLGLIVGTSVSYRTDCGNSFVIWN